MSIFEELKKRVIIGDAEGAVECARKAIEKSRPYSE